MEQNNEGLRVSFVISFVMLIGVIVIALIPPFKNTTLGGLFGLGLGIVLLFIGMVIFDKWIIK